MLSIDFHSCYCDLCFMDHVQPSQVLTANRLRSGGVVYWRHGGWVDHFRDAEVLLYGREAESALAKARECIADRAVVNPYLFPVRAGDGRAQPMEKREVIRADGPSVRADIGKQTEAPRHV